MIFRKYSEFLDTHRIDESLKAARKYLNVSTAQAIQQEIAHKRGDIVKFTKAKDFEQAKAAKDESKALEEQLSKVEVLDKIVQMLGPSRQAWIYAFTKFYFECFVDNLEEEQRLEALRQVMNDLNELDKRQLFAQLPLVKANPGAGLTNYADVVPADDTPENRRHGLERLTDDIRDTMVLLTVNKFIAELPGQFTVKNERAKDFGTTVPSFKDAARNATGRQKEQIKEIAVAFDELSDSPKDKHALQKVFFWGCKRYRTLNELISKAYEYIQSSGVGDIAALRLKIYEACERFGQANGAEIVYDEGGVCVFEVRSFQANVLINAKTKHCIKDHYSHWDSYVSADTNFNKQYYIWDFNVNSADSKHIIGVTVEPEFRIRAAHMKMDENITSSIKKYVKDNLGIKFEDVFLPMTPTEIEMKKKRIAANKVMLKDPLTVEEADQAIKDGADPNTREGKPLENAVKANKLELAEFLIKVGAKATIGRPMDHAETVKMIALLKSNGAEITDAAIENSVGDPEAVRFLLEEGNLDPNEPYPEGQPEAKPVRAAIRKGSLESVKLLIAAGGEVYMRRFLAIRQAFEHGHLDIARFLIDHIKSKNLSIDQNIYDETIDRIEIAGKVRDKRKLKKVIEEAKKMLAEVLK
jgi:hypothetical protein